MSCIGNVFYNFSIKYQAAHFIIFPIYRVSYSVYLRYSIIGQSYSEFSLWYPFSFKYVIPEKNEIELTFTLKKFDRKVRKNTISNQERSTSNILSAIYH